MKKILDISLIDEISKTGYVVIKKFVPIELIEKVGELCSKPDLEKEKLRITVENLENIIVLD